MKKTISQINLDKQVVSNEQTKKIKGGDTIIIGDAAVI